MRSILFVLAISFTFGSFWVPQTASAQSGDVNHLCYCRYTKTSEPNVEKITSFDESRWRINWLQTNGKDLETNPPSEALCREFCTAFATGGNGGTYLQSSYNRSIRPKRDPIIPILGFSLPGLEPDDFEAGIVDGNVRVNFLGLYINAVYQVLIGVAAVASVIMVIVGGIQYMLSAGTGETKEAMKRIRNALAGFVLLIAAYTLLNVTNPQTTLFRSLELGYIDPVALVKTSGDTAGSVTTASLSSIDIDCPQSGGTDAVGDIARSFQGKTTYRLGAKGDPPPYSDETRTDPTGRPYSGYCAAGTVCIDCSGFVGLVAKCAGLDSANESGGTVGIFSSAPRVSNCSDGSVTTEDGTQILLEPGDLLGFMPGDIPDADGGHVWIYIGDGRVMDSHGGNGRQPGNAIGNYTIQWMCSSYDTIRIRDRNP